MLIVVYWKNFNEVIIVTASTIHPLLITIKRRTITYHVIRHSNTPLLLNNLIDIYTVKRCSPIKLSAQLSPTQRFVKNIS